MSETEEKTDEPSVATGASKTGRKLKGEVVKLSGKKTISVLVTRPKMHPRYKKQMRWSKKYLTHDLQEVAKVGDKVEIIEGRPLSKRKSFYLVRVID